jgi:hypothetical protein
MGYEPRDVLRDLDRPEELVTYPLGQEPPGAARRRVISRIVLQLEPPTSCPTAGRANLSRELYHRRVVPKGRRAVCAAAQLVTSP